MNLFENGLPIKSIGEADALKRALDLRARIEKLQRMVLREHVARILAPITIEGLEADLAAHRLAKQAASQSTSSLTAEDLLKLSECMLDHEEYTP